MIPLQQLSKPKYGLLLLSFAFLIGLTRVLFHLWNLKHFLDLLPWLNMKSVFIIFALMVSLVVLFSFFLLYKIFKGKNWARITYLIMFLIGLIDTIQKGKILIWINQESNFLYVYGLEIIISLAAFVLIFSKKSNQFFKN